MSKRWMVLFILLMMSSLTLAQNEGRDYAGYRWFDDGITFFYPFSIAEDAVSTFVPASADEPESTKIVFQNYYDDSGWLSTGAEITVMPAATVPPGLAEQMQALMENASSPEYKFRPAGIPSAVAVTASHGMPLNFQAGHGVRFVVAMGDSSDLTYQYQGMTEDGIYLVTAVFPLMPASAAGGFLPDLATLDTLIQSLSITPPAAMLFTAQTGSFVDYEGVQFSYNPELAYRIEVDAVSPVAGADAENTMFGVMPGYRQFTFAGFPAVGSVQYPQLWVMPVSEFPDAGQVYGMRLAELQRFLTEHPALSSIASLGNQEAALPLLPVFNAAQVMVSHPAYLRFGNGEGVRFITYYAQDYSPLTANDLFYAYAGLSDDGQFVVAAIFPLYAGFLPQDRAAYNAADWERFGQNYQTYLDGLLLQIDVMGDTAFVPYISLLDAVIASVSVK